MYILYKQINGNISAVFLQVSAIYILYFHSGRKALPKMHYGRSKIETGEL